jgi:hypothetical protein
MVLMVTFFRGGGAPVESVGEGDGTASEGYELYRT